MISRSGFVFLMFYLTFQYSCIQKKDKQELENEKEFGTELLRDFFSDAEINELANILEEFDHGICEGLKSNNIVRCYELNHQTLKMDFFQDNPVYLNYPYDGQLMLSEYNYDGVIAAIWNDYCQMEIKKIKKRLSFYCLQTAGPFMDYMNAWTTVNGTYRNIIPYIESEQFSVYQRKLMYMDNTEIDMTDPDARIIHAILQITLAQEYHILFGEDHKADVPIE